MNAPLFRGKFGPRGPRNLFERLARKDAAPVGYGRQLPVAVRRDPVTLAMPAATVAAYRPSPRAPLVGSTTVEIRDGLSGAFNVYWRGECIVQDTRDPMADAGRYLVSRLNYHSSVAFRFEGAEPFAVWVLNNHGGCRGAAS